MGRDCGVNRTDNQWNERRNPAPRPLSESEVHELAEACVALFEAKGQLVEVTLRGMGVEAGGMLLPEDAPRVQSKAETLLGVSRTEKFEGREQT